MILFNAAMASCGELNIDPFRLIATCGEQRCRYSQVTYDLELAAIQIDCLPEVLLADGFETQSP